MVDFLSSTEKKELLSKLEKYGIEKIPFLLVKSGQEKIRAFSGNLSVDEIREISRSVYVEGIGLYFAKIDGEDIRLTVDSLHLLKDQIKHNTLKLTDEQLEKYLKGQDIEANQKQLEQINNRKIYFILKHDQDILGMTKIVTKQIRNYLPKERRRKH